MKKVLFLIAVFYGISFSQPVFHPPLLSDINVIPSDSINLVYYSYRIPSNFFVFFKDGSKYSANYRITVEVSDSASQYFARRIDEKKIDAGSFEETTAGNTFQEGLLVFKLKKGKYIFTPIVTDLNSNHEYRLPSLKAVAEKGHKDNFLHPIVINQNGGGSGENYKLTNFGGEIPFSEDQFGMIIPCTDTSVKSIKVSMINGKDTLKTITVGRSYKSKISFKMTDSGISVERSGNSVELRNFVLRNFSRKLNEGRLKIIVNKGEGNKQEFNKRIIWFNEPFSLRDPERAIKFLKIVERGNVVDSLLSGSSKNYAENLFKYWKKFDPTPNSAFNPLMEEYYKRVDYALRHFFPITKRREEITDRGKIYIKYGKPAEVKRSYDQYGKSIETWIYKKPHKIFDFIDPDGTGNFILVKE